MSESTEEEGVAPSEPPELTQGLSSARKKNVFGNWCEIVLARLEGRYSSIVPSVAVQEAERGLALISPSSYWYFSRVDSLYGRVLMIWQGKRFSSLDAEWVTPFDTGGLWRGYMNVPICTTVRSRQEYVAKYSWPALDAFPIFLEWLNSSFFDAQEYVFGTAFPERIIHSECILNEEIEPVVQCKAWSWEYRVKSGQEDFPQPDRIYWARSDLLAFRQYLIVEGDEMMNHEQIARLLQRTSVVESSTNLAMQHARRDVASQLKDVAGVHNHAS